MIETLYGPIIEVDTATSSAVIECAGVGYHVTITANTLSKLPSVKYLPSGDIEAGDPVRIYTHLSVREDAVELYGFYSRDELSMFRVLIGVSGVGPKAAMSILSLFTPRSLARTVAIGDAKSISRAPGVGAKTAARLILETKDKIAKTFPQFTLDASDTGEIVKTQTPPSNNLTDARDALTALGYSRSEIAAAMKDVDTTADVESIIKAALNALMKN